MLDMPREASFLARLLKKFSTCNQPTVHPRSAVHANVVFVRASKRAGAAKSSPTAAALAASTSRTELGAVPASRTRLTAAQKLRFQADFVRARQQGLRMDCGPFLLNAFHVEGAVTVARIGVVTGKKMLGDAVHRNRMRRVFREIFRLHPDAWPAGWDVVVVPRRSCLNRDYTVLRRLYLESSARLLARNQAPARKRPAHGGAAPGAEASHA